MSRYHGMGSRRSLSVSVMNSSPSVQRLNTNEMSNAVESDASTASSSFSVKPFVFKSDKAFNPAKLEDFLGAIVQVYGPKMLRYKGVLYMKGSDRKVIFQGVHQLMGSDLGPKWAPGEEKGSKVVFIGIDLPKDVLMQGLEQCLV